ncbi:UpxY family transcription antiterminator [Kordia sp.]|uniref:UpxY family transcription antiterminator n=1 Tax=Kordia sp. TaxID=1965332 RepID=UPI003B594E74
MNHLYNGWHVLYVRSRHEKKVYEALLDLSLDVFLPLMKTKKKWSDRIKIVYQPLFPSYVFVNLNSPSDYNKALSVSGACAYIKFGRDFAKVSEDEINKIKLLVGSEDINNLVTDANIPKVGEIKKIEFGSLSGLECEILKADNINKIIVRIESLQQNITAVIPSYYFENKSVTI